MLQGCDAGDERPKLCSGVQRAAVRQWEGASSRWWPALPLPRAASLSFFDAGDDELWPCCGASQFVAEEEHLPLAWHHLDRAEREDRVAALLRDTAHGGWCVAWLSERNCGPRGGQPRAAAVRGETKREEAKREEAKREEAKREELRLDELRSPVLPCNT